MMIMFHSSAMCSSVYWHIAGRFTMSYAFRVYEIRASSGWKIKLLIQEVAGQARAIVWVRWVSYLALRISRLGTFILKGSVTSSNTNLRWRLRLAVQYCLTSTAKKVCKAYLKINLDLDDPALMSKFGYQERARIHGLPAALWRLRWDYCGQSWWFNVTKEV